MLQPNINITPRYRQETHYNYAKNSGFWPSSFAGKERDSETGFSYFGAGKISQNILLIALLCIGLNANAKIDMNNKIVLCNASNVVSCNEVCEKDSVSSFLIDFVQILIFNTVG